MILAALSFGLGVASGIFLASRSIKKLGAAENESENLRQSLDVAQEALARAVDPIPRGFDLVGRMRARAARRRGSVSSSERGGD